MSDNDKVKKEGGAPSARRSKKKLQQQKLQVYQNMCREVSLEPLDTINRCITNLKSKLVNIVDYIDAKRRGIAVVVWPPERFEDFKRYTLAADKRMDQEEARKGDGFLAALLKNLRGSNAAKTYERRRDTAAIARDRYTNRASRGVPGKRAIAITPFAIKQESPSGVIDTSVRQNCEVISTMGRSLTLHHPSGFSKRSRSRRGANTKSFPLIIQNLISRHLAGPSERALPTHALGALLAALRLYCLGRSHALRRKR